MLNDILSPWTGHYPDNVWIGVSAGTQRRAEERLPLLLKVPAVVRFVSCEPLLEALDLTPWLGGLHWIITGGESGHQARPMNLEWARALRMQCLMATVPYFFKQVGGRYHNSGGRLLDGRLWNDLPPEHPALVRGVGQEGASCAL